MNTRHRIELDGSELRTAVLQYLDSKGETAPDTCVVRCLTQRSFRHDDEQNKRTCLAIEVTWGNPSGGE